MRTMMMGKRRVELVMEMMEMVEMVSPLSVSSVLHRTGLPGKNCLLRAVCEVLKVFRVSFFL